MKLTTLVKSLIRLYLLASFFTLFLVFHFSVISFANDQNSLIDGHSHDEIKRGERFFKGLLPFNFKGQSCVSCHNIMATDTLNWNPSAMAIAVKYSSLDFESFQASIEQPVGNRNNFV